MILPDTRVIPEPECQAPSADVRQLMSLAIGWGLQKRLHQAAGRAPFWPVWQSMWPSPSPMA